VPARRFPTVFSFLSRTEFTEADINTYRTHVAGVTRRLETSFKAQSRVPIGNGARGFDTPLAHAWAKCCGLASARAASTG